MTKQTKSRTAMPHASTVWVSVDEIALRFGVSRNTVWRWSRTSENKFPNPVRLTPRVTRWRLADIERFEKALAGASSP